MKKNFLLLWGILLSALCFAQTIVIVGGGGVQTITRCYNQSIDISLNNPGVQSGETKIQYRLVRAAANGTTAEQVVGEQAIPLVGPGLKTIKYNNMGSGIYTGKYVFFNGTTVTRTVSSTNSLNVTFFMPNFKINDDEATLSQVNPSISNVLSCQGIKIFADCIGSVSSISVQEVNPTTLANIGDEVFKDFTAQDRADLIDGSKQFDAKLMCTNGVNGKSITFTNGKLYRIKLIDNNVFNQYLETIKFIYYKTGDFDLYMKDNEADNGYESTDPYPNVYASPDLWNRLGTTPFTYDTKHQNIDYSTSQYNRAYIRIHNQGCTASTESKLYMYWTRARLDEEWEKFWKYDLTNNAIYDGSQMRQGGGEITINDINDPSSATKELTIPAGIEPNAVYHLVDDYTSGQEWVAPNPAWYTIAGFGSYSSAFYQGVQRPIICMLARLVNTSDPISFSSTSTPIDPYVRKNNNVVTRNSALVDDPAFLVSNPNGGWNHGWNTVMVNNSRSTGQTINLHLDLIPEETEATQPFSDFGEIYLGLGSDLWALWVSGGKLGSGIEEVETGILRVTDYNNAVLEGIAMKDASFNENFTFGVRFDYFGGVTAPAVVHNYAYQISQEFPSLENIHGSNAVLYTSVQAAGSSKTGALNTPKWEAEKEQDKINVYPNPFDGSTTALVNITQAGNYTIAVKDIMGRTIETLCDNCTLQQGKHNFAIDGAKYDAGVYFVTIFGGDSQNTIKIIKQE